MKKVYIKRFILIILLLSVVLLPRLFNKPIHSQIDEDVDVAFTNESFGSTLSDPGVVVEDFVTMSSLYAVIENGRNASLSDAAITQNITNEVGNKKVSISTADELYMFGNAQSINFNSQGGTNTTVLEQTIKKVLSLDYVLLADIDYSVKKSQKFVPIGTNILLAAGEVTDEQIQYYFPFTGTFDGNGFEIKNLYLAEFSYITTTFQDEEATTAITVGLFKQYAMFSTVGTTGVIKNFILRNPILELMTMDATSGLFQTAMLVGENKGEITNVAVIDEKINNVGQPNAGIIFDVLYPGSETYTAAGFVYNNEGSINNSYLVSNRVIAGGTEYRFTEIAPFVYSNSGTITNSMHNNDITTKAYSNTYSGLTPISKNDLRIGNNVTINGGYQVGEEAWYFYKDDGYPQLKGLNYVNGEYQINDEYDLIIFGYLLNLVTEVNGKLFDSHHYVLTNHINMRNIINYQTPSREFKGLLYGGNTDFSLNGTTNINKYIYNLNLSNPYVRGNNYHLGLFSRLSGTVRNINFYNNNVTVKNSNSHYGKTIHVGMVTAELMGGTIKNVITNSTIDLGNEALGLTYAGSIAGLGFGVITYVTNNGLVDGGKHDFRNYNIIPRFYVGGIIGANNNSITISYTFNNGNVLGVGTSGSLTNYNAQAGTIAKSYTGGIIGEVTNHTINGSSLVYLTNNGLVDANDFRGKNSNLKAEMFVGGIFGSVSGFGFKLNDGSKVRNGRLENKANVKGSYLNENTKLFAAGIGVANTTEEKANISYLTNSGGYEFNNLNYKTHNRYLYYASTIIDNSDNGIKLSRAYNEQNYIIDQQYFNATATDISEPSEILMSLFFVSTKNAPSELLFVENSGDLTVGQAGVNTTVIRKLKISNITQATRVDYKNVINSGDITVLRINNTNDSIYVAGVSFVLAYDGKAYTMESVVNEGKIITAGILGNTNIVGQVIGPSFSDSTFSSTLEACNLYVAGVVNINIGEITNAFNLGSITSTYNTNLKDIHGRANTFVGGINTFNYNLIQNAANGGLIEYTNSNENSESYFAATTNVSTDNKSRFGGISIAYNGGLVLGGITAAFGDVSGTELEGNKNFGSNEIPVAQVIDTANEGDIYGKAKEYVRSGGILGVALSVELASGTSNNNSDILQITAGPFTTAVIGSEDPVSQSLLSNGLNFGNIYAVTSNIGSYGGDSNGAVKFDNSYGSSNDRANAMRPGINASAGGVIAYGLTKMVRMINHGTISSTDVAGGVVGATYILGGADQPSTPITTVTINTAVNYGKIKAIKTGTYNSSRVYVFDNNLYNNFVYNVEENFASNRYWQPNEYSLFIYYGEHQNELIETYQQARCGFGGIFGRLQRGNYGTMSSNEFNNIINMDEDIDLIGRVDSNTPGSLVYYRFFTGEFTYFSAKEEDKTPNAFTGWTMNVSTDVSNVDSADVIIRVERTGRNNYQYRVYSVEISNTIGTATEERIRRVMRPGNSSATNGPTEVLTIHDLETRTFNVNYSNNPLNISTYGLTTTDVSGLDYSGTGNTRYANLTINNHDVIPNFSTATTYGNNNGPTGNSGRYRFMVPYVSDDPNNTNAQYIFDPSFPLMQSENTEFIYPVAQDALADRFQNDGENPKPNGMYVLSSSTGSTDGAALPTNLSISDMFRLNESEFKFIDLENVSSTNKVENSNLINSYNDMKQLNYNDKSEILPVDEDKTPLIADLELYDPDGNSPFLTGGTITYGLNPTITFNLNSNAFTGNDLQYKIFSNELSNNAIIAINNITPSQYTQFRTDYNNRENNMLLEESIFSPTFEAEFTNNVAEFTIRVYSEIYALDSNIYDAGKYFTDYKVIINRSTTNITTNATITVDGQSESFLPIGPNVETINQMNPTGTLTANFIGTTLNVRNLIPLNHKMVVEGLYLVEGSNETKIHSDYYNLVIIPNNTNGNFGFTITLSDSLKAGDYRIKYQYFNTSAIRTINFTKRPSTNRDVIDVVYDYFSNDLLGNELEFIPNGNNAFTTYIKFGKLFEEITNTNQPLTIEENNYQVEYSYIDNLNYYNVFLNGEHILELKLAPFASININGNNTIRYEYDSQTGLKHYVLTYQIESENESSYSNVIHHIIERDVNERLIYLDDNLVSNTYDDDAAIPIARETILATLNIDYNFLELDLNNQISATLESTPLVLYNNDVEALQAGAIVYIIKEEDDYFTIKITDKLDKGDRKSTRLNSSHVRIS